MKTTLPVGALALAVSIAVPARAQDETAITVQSPLLHPAAGLMDEHMHEGGEAMIAVRFERFHAGGTNQAGTAEVADPAIVAAGFSSRTRSMTMDMVMVDLMYAPAANLTLMVMPHYMWHRMEMIGIDPANGTGAGSHAGHTAGQAIPFGETHDHATRGLGDTLLSASYRLLRGPRLGAHATLGVWAPTGKVDLKDVDGRFVHYGMQPGGGTWDIEPSLTVTGRTGPLGWGGQAAYRWRTGTANDSGFRFGDKARATGWLSYLLGSHVGTTARLEYVHEGKVEGHYNAAHNHVAPPDRQANYGGDVVTAGFGFNWLLPLASERRPQMGAELTLPLSQDLNGIQPPQDWRLSMSLSQTF